MEWITRVPKRTFQQNQDDEYRHYAYGIESVCGEGAKGLAYKENYG
jgi:hypothetical protein